MGVHLLETTNTGDDDEKDERSDRPRDASLCYDRIESQLGGDASRRERNERRPTRLLAVAAIAGATRCTSSWWSIWRNDWRRESAATHTAWCPRPSCRGARTGCEIASLE